MTDTEQSAVATLRELLPEIESGKGALDDDILAQILCVLHGAPPEERQTLESSHHFMVWIGETEPPIYSADRNRCPDTDLTAADKLVREVLPEAIRDYQISEDVGNTAEITVHKPRLEDTTVFGADNERSICRAILAALVRAKIATLEASDANV